VKTTPGLIVVGWLLGVVYANAAPLELHVQENGLVRFGSGVELNNNQLRGQIHILMKQNPRPDIQLLPDKMTKYDAVGKVLAAFQAEGYGPHFGFTGVTK
jgi:biopolymer transport protein ExbD